MKMVVAGGRRGWARRGGAGREGKRAVPSGAGRESEGSPGRAVAGRGDVRARSSVWPGQTLWAGPRARWDAPVAPPATFIAGVMNRRQLAYIELLPGVRRNNDFQGPDANV